MTVGGDDDPERDPEARGYHAGAGRDSMRAAIVDSAGRLDVRESAIPEPGPGTVRIRVEACGLCGSDLHAMRRGSWPAGAIPGHEIAGRIDAFGPLARAAPSTPQPSETFPPRLEQGTPVVLEPLETCGACRACLAGRDAQCPSLRIAGVDRPGGFATYAVAPIARVHPYDPAIAADLATLAEPLAVALHALDRIALVPGERVLVLGGGPIGLLCAFAARHAGGRGVTLRARYPHQAERARRLGIEFVHSTEQPIEADGLADRFDVVLETVGGESSTLVEAARAARPGGRVAVLGLFGRDPALDPGLALAKELTLVWSNCYASAGGAAHRRKTPYTAREESGSATAPRVESVARAESPATHESDFRRALRILAHERDRLGELITHRMPLEQIAEAFSLAARKESRIGKLVVLA